MYVTRPGKNIGKWRLLETYTSSIKFPTLNVLFAGGYTGVNFHNRTRRQKKAQKEAWRIEDQGLLIVFDAGDLLQVLDRRSSDPVLRQCDYLMLLNQRFTLKPIRCASDFRASL